MLLYQLNIKSIKKISYALSAEKWKILKIITFLIDDVMYFMLIKLKEVN